MQVSHTTDLLTEVQLCFTIVDYSYIERTEPFNEVGRKSRGTSDNSIGDFHCGLHQPSAPRKFAALQSWLPLGDGSIQRGRSERRDASQTSTAVWAGAWKPSQDLRHLRFNLIRRSFAAFQAADNAAHDVRQASCPGAVRLHGMHGPATGGPRVMECHGNAMPRATECHMGHMGPTARKAGAATVQAATGQHFGACQ